ncbi:hypothetical protein ES703_90678 [subsurface metagenome]
MTGSGTLLDPYVIWDVNDLQDMNLDLTAYYELGQDIDASATVGWNAGLGFVPIAPVFIGNFDGKGHTITNLFINRPAESRIGLFGTILNATIVNVGLVDCDITGRDNTGGLLGSADGGGTILNCYTTGQVTGRLRVGGLIGEASDIPANTITRCYSMASVTGSRGEVGGLVGLADETVISACYATGNITALPGADWDFGGLVGNNYGTIERSYATGAISAPDSDYIGGLVGETFNSITDCYARGNVNGRTNVGGLVGQNGAGGAIDNCYSTGAVAGTFRVGGLVGYQAVGATTPTDSFWDTETSGTLISDGGTGKTTTEMKMASTFISTGWGFGTIWGMTGACNDGYACLLDVTSSCAYTLWKGNINIDQLIYQHAERMRV